MATTRKEKEESLASLTEDIKNAKGVVVTEYRGMTVKQLDKIRKNLRKENIKYQVVKVTLLKKALTALGIQSENLKYTGPVALAVSNEDQGFDDARRLSCVGGIRDHCTAQQAYGGGDGSAGPVTSVHAATSASF